MSKETQKLRLVRVLRSEGKIDNFRAINDGISYRLGARIYDLKQEGWEFYPMRHPEQKQNYIYIVKKDPNND